MNAHTLQELKAYQGLSLRQKVIMSQGRIREWYKGWKHYGIYNDANGKIRTVLASEEPMLKPSEEIVSVEDGKVVTSFSGGKDSTVLDYLVSGMYPDVKAVFVNTGLEFPEIQSFVKKRGNVEIIYPEMRFDEVIKKYGYPIISKEVSETVSQARYSLERADGRYFYRLLKINGTAVDKQGRKSLYNCEKYKPLLYTDFRVSNMCCNVMKKKPFRSHFKDYATFVGTLAEESRLRTSSWVRHGCNAFEGKHPTSSPLSFWTNQDILQFIKSERIEIASVYGDIVYKNNPDQLRIDDFGISCGREELCTTGCNRTGCVYCGFGAHLDKGESRFQRLKRTHPKQYNYCMNGGGVQ